MNKFWKDENFFFLITSDNYITINQWNPAINQLICLMVNLA